MCRLRFEQRLELGGAHACSELIREIHFMLPLVILEELFLSNADSFEIGTNIFINTDD